MLAALSWIFCLVFRQRFANKTFISPEDARGKKEIKVSLHEE
jgi:hypothetical protein